MFTTQESFSIRWERSSWKTICSNHRSLPSKWISIWYNKSLYER